MQGTDAKEVQEVMLALIEKTNRQQIMRPPSPWASGSFYLVVFVIVIAALSVVGRILPIIALPIVFIAGIIALSVIGAFQMRQDSKLSEKSFLELMALSFKYLPWIRKQDSTKT